MDDCACAGILAIGAIADGCGRLVEPHLPTLMPFLISTLDDAKPLIRSISCWSVSRYAPWIVAQPQVEEMAGATVTPYLGEILQVLLAAFGKYQAKNLLILFDAVATLAEGTLPAPVRCASRGWDLTSVGSGACSGGQRDGAAGGGRRADARGAGQVGEPTR